MEFGKIFSRCSYAVYLHRVPEKMLNPLCSAYVSISIASGNEQISQSYMENIAYNCSFTYGTIESFGSIFLFCVNFYGRSYFTGTINQRFDKRRQKSNHSIQTWNRIKTFNIVFTSFILSVCCTKIHCTCWDKGVKDASPSAKLFLRYLYLNTSASKMVSRWHTTQT